MSERNNRRGRLFRMTNFRMQAHHTAGKIDYCFSRWWEDFPVWLCVLSLIADAVMAMREFLPSRPEFILTAIFPLIGIGGYFSARPSTHPIQTAFLVVTSVAAVLCLCAAFLRPSLSFPRIVKLQGHAAPFSPDIQEQSGSIVTAANGRRYRVEGIILVDLQEKRQLTFVYECIAISLSALLFIHCLYFRGWYGIKTFFLITLAYGILLENGGVTMGFFRENDYHFVIPGLQAPAATIAGWSNICYLTIFVYDTLCTRWKQLSRVHPAVAGICISLIALSWDVTIDPIATNSALWTWHETLQPFFLGVPLLNFTSWASAMFVYGTGYVFIERHTKWTHAKRHRALFAMLPLFLFVAAFINFGFFFFVHGANGPEWRILRTYLGKVIQ